MKNLVPKLITIGLCGLFLISCNPQSKNKKKSEFKYSKEKQSKLPEHPRLFFSSGERNKILKSAKKDPLLGRLINILHQQANAILALPLIKPTAEGTTNLHKSRKAISQILTLSLAYRLFNDKRYAKKVEENLLNISKFKSWHPEHFLDTAEMTVAVAIGYDWCYDQLSEKAQDTIAKAIVHKAFAPAWPVYKNGDKGSWAKRNTNWNLVCNSGLVAGALAIADKYPKDARKIIQYAVQFTPNEIKNYAPNGVYYEGPAYWNYATMYLCLLFDNFHHVLGYNFGISSMQGVSKTAKYYINTLSPSDRVFNFADASGTNATLEPIYFFFSKYYNQPEVAAFYRSYLKKTLNKDDVKKKKGVIKLPRYFFLAIPWFDDAVYNGTLNTAKLQVFKGNPDILAFNGNKGNASELFLIAKEGDPATAHNQMDVGSFVMESQGVRWAIDLGAEKYSFPGFWDYRPIVGQRWKYFRNTNLAHNTINIDGKIAYSRCRGYVPRFNLSEKSPFGIINMSSCYKNQADSVMRGFRMISPNLMLIRDHIKLKNGSKKVNWRFFTKADISVKGNIIRLEQDEKKFYLKIFPQENIKIHVNRNVRPYSPKARPIVGVKMIQLSSKANSRKSNWVSIAVLMGKNITALKDMSFDNLSPMVEW